MRWLIEASEENEFGEYWDIKKLDGDKLEHIATFNKKVHAEDFLAARKWMDTLGDGMMSLDIGRPKPKPRPKPKAKRPPVKKAAPAKRTR